MTSPSEDYRLIPLTQGQFAKVSPEDFDWLSQWKWHALWEPHTKGFYARRGVYVSAEKVEFFIMHREILRLARGDSRMGDHINHDTLDNRRENLRIATTLQNAWNQKTSSNSTSGLRGVFPQNGKWRARIRIGGRLTSLGMHATPEAAHEAWKAAAKAGRGEFFSD